MMFLKKFGCYLCPHTLLDPVGGCSDILPVWWCPGSLSVDCLMSGSSAVRPLLCQTCSQDPQASQVSCPVASVPKARVTARDKDEFVLEVAYHLPLLVPAQEAVQDNEDHEIQWHGFAGTDTRRLGWNRLTSDQAGIKNTGLWLANQLPCSLARSFQDFPVYLLQWILQLELKSYSCCWPKFWPSLFTEAEWEKYRV